LPNLTKLQQTLDTIVDNPKSHYQESWIDPGNADLIGAPNNEDRESYYWRFAAPPVTCGTAFCVAGHRVHADGYHFVAEGAYKTLSYVVPKGKVEAYLAYEIESEHVERVASASFDLTDNQATVLFDSGNSLLDIFAAAYAVTNGAIKLPEQVVAGWDGEHVTEANVVQLLNEWATDPEYRPINEDDNVEEALSAAGGYAPRWNVAVNWLLADLPTVEAARQQDHDDDLEGMRTALGPECLDHDH
jgi:hypothetical protein